MENLKKLMENLEENLKQLVENLDELVDKVIEREPIYGYFECEIK